MPSIEKEIPINSQFNSLKQFLYPVFWFLIGFVITATLITGFCFTYFQYKYKDKVIPGVFIGNTYIGGKSKTDVTSIFNNRNIKIGKSTFTFEAENETATVSAKDLGIGYNAKLLAQQSIDLGKSEDIMSNMYIIITSFINGTYLSPSYTFNDEYLKKAIMPISESVYQKPTDALFTVRGNRVSAFRESENGKSVDYEKLKTIIDNKLAQVIDSKSPQNYLINVPILIVKPKVTTEKANNLGIVEVIGEGHSLFQHSAASRIHNVILAASRINGVLVAPGQVFSFDQNLGDVSSYTGYQQAYVISGGHTVLGDGGGVCQVSTTLFRAVLNAGLPIVERHPHSYRVGYYEEDSPPGIDATVYVPTVDLKFKNDTGNYILVQSSVDPTNLALTFTLYGTRDGRVVSMTTPVVTNQIPAPAPLYQDDPSLPAGEVKQIDFAANGADVSFHRTVTKNGKVIISEDYNTHYSPWQAVYLKGTKT